MTITIAQMRQVAADIAAFKAECPYQYRVVPMDYTVAFGKEGGYQPSRGYVGRLYQAPTGAIALLVDARRSGNEPRVDISFTREQARALRDALTALLEDQP